MTDETRRQRHIMAIFIHYQRPTRATGRNAQSANGLPTQLSTASKSSLHPAKTAFAKAVHGFSTKISTNKAACTYQTQPKSAYNFAISNPINHHDTI